MPRTTVKVVQDAAEAVPTEVLATSIRDIAEGVRKLRHGSLNDRALFLLIQSAAPSNVTIRDIKSVFDGIDGLERAFIRRRAS